MSFAVFNPISTLRAGARRLGGRAAGAARSFGRGVLMARTLLVLVAGVACLAIGVAMIFPPAGLIVLGALLIIGGYPTRDGGEQ